jgi:putative tryptophan/tyrosine transport system substrate-binding protein
MRRRESIAMAGTAVSWPLAARAQQGARVRRIGVLTGRAGDTESLGWVEAFRRRLGELGWHDGRNVRIEPGHSGLNCRHCCSPAPTR